MKNYYKTNDEYDYISHFMLYENVTSQKKNEEKQGLILRKNGIYYQNLENVETLNFKYNRLIVNNDDETIQVLKNINDVSVINIKLLFKTILL